VSALCRQIYRSGQLMTPSSKGETNPESVAGHCGPFQPSPRLYARVASVSEITQEGRLRVDAVRIRGFLARCDVALVQDFEAK
jgi:hypothetical protein